MCPVHLDREKTTNLSQATNKLNNRTTRCVQYTWTERKPPICQATNKLNNRARRCVQYTWTGRKPPNCHKSQTNFITMLYRAHLAMNWFELTTLVVIGTDCTGSCKSNYHAITITTAPSIFCCSSGVPTFFPNMNFYLLIFFFYSCQLSQSRIPGQVINSNVYIYFFLTVQIFKWSYKV
jgi:hypothetical protein